MKIITLWQPWASFIALGLRQYETRSWFTNYRGKLLIHAAKRPIDEEGKYLIGKLRHDFNKEVELSDHESDYPLGAIVAISDLTKCFLMTATASDPGIRKSDFDGTISVLSVSPIEEVTGFWQPGRYAWAMENIKALKPIPYKGSQGLRDIDPNYLELVKRAV